MKNKAPMKIISDNSRLSWHTFVADKGGCGHIRVIFPSLLCNILKIEGKQINFFPSYNMQYILDKEFYKDKLFVVFQRAATEKQLEFVKFFQSNMIDETKTGMIYEIDDNLIDVPDWNMAADYYNKNRKYSLDMIKRCHGVTASTEHLATKLRKYNKNVKVNLNHLPKFMWGDVPEIQESNKKKRILWTGSANHFALPNSDKKGGDFDNYLLDYIVKTIDKYQWVFIGAMPKELYDVRDKIEFHKWQNIYNYPMFLKNLNIDMGIAPILDIDFNRSKSNIKALEYTAAGIPAVYSDVEPYKNLTYTSKSGEEMINQIEFLVDSDDERKKVFENDYKILEKQLFWEEHGNLYNYINTFLNFFEMRLPDEEKI